MKLKQTLLSLCAITVLGSLTTNLHAQVTIGSNEKPIEGALLMLNDGTTASSNNENAQKGLGLPRVELTTLTPAIGKLAESIGSTSGTTPWNEDTHVGLVVYNAIKYDACDPATNPYGFYVWDGEMWQGIGIPRETDHSAENIPDLTTGIGTVTDYEGHVYNTKRFKDGSVDAGIWITENLYSLVKANGTTATCPDGASLNTAKYSTANAAVRIKSSADYSGTVAYGQSASVITATNQSLAMADYAKEFGLLYTHAQAMEASPRVGVYLPMQIGML